MNTFKFLKKQFNPEDYDSAPDFRFLGVSPIFQSEDTGRNCRTSIFVYTVDGTIVPAFIIHEDHEAYHEATIYEVRGNQVFEVPREDEYKYIRLTPNSNENV